MVEAHTPSPTHDIFGHHPPERRAVLRGIGKEALGADAPHVASALHQCHPFIQRALRLAALRLHLSDPGIPGRAILRNGLPNLGTDRRQAPGANGCAWLAGSHGDPRESNQRRNAVRGRRSNRGTIIPAPRSTRGNQLLQRAHDADLGRSVWGCQRWTRPRTTASPETRTRSGPEAWITAT
jgi:hypothetical protein